MGGKNQADPSSTAARYIRSPPATGTKNLGSTYHRSGGGGGGECLASSVGVPCGGTDIEYVQTHTLWATQSSLAGAVHGLSPCRSNHKCGSAQQAHLYIREPHDLHQPPLAQDVSHSAPIMRRSHPCQRGFIDGAPRRMVTEH